MTHRGSAFALACLLLTAQAAFAQKVHYLHDGVSVPGATGQAALRTGKPLPGYFQPVEISTTHDMKVSLASHGHFERPAPAPVLAGMLIGQLYRFKITEIPLRTGHEVFPTIELVDRLYPPHGFEKRFPIPIQITRQDVELALSGKFVTRVIYVEDPLTALPVREGEEQRVFDVAPGRDPLETADELGRPVAILRIGGRVPLAGETDFADCSPPVIKLPRPYEIQRAEPIPPPIRPQEEMPAPAEFTMPAPAAYTEPAPAVYTETAPRAFTVPAEALPAAGRWSYYEGEEVRR